MPKAQIIEPCERMTRTEYKAWRERQPHGRFERIDGVVVAMAPERVEHNDRKMQALLALRRAVRDAGVPCHVNGDGMTVEIGDSDYGLMPSCTAATDWLPAASQCPIRGGRRSAVSDYKRHGSGMEGARILSAPVGPPLPDRLGRPTADRTPSSRRCGRGHDRNAHKSRDEARPAGDHDPCRGNLHGLAHLP
jgi:hypothetical protein